MVPEQVFRAWEKQKEVLRLQLAANGAKPAPHGHRQGARRACDAAQAVAVRLAATIRVVVAADGRGYSPR